MNNGPKRSEKERSSTPPPRVRFNTPERTERQPRNREQDLQTGRDRSATPVARDSGEQDGERGRTFGRNYYQTDGRNERQTGRATNRQSGGYYPGQNQPWGNQGRNRSDSNDNRCGNCGLGHKREERCPAAGTRCTACGIMNHWGRCCRSTRGSRVQNQRSDGGGDRRQ